MEHPIDSSLVMQPPPQSCVNVGVPLTDASGVGMSIGPASWPVSSMPPPPVEPSTPNSGVERFELLSNCITEHAPPKAAVVAKREKKRANERFVEGMASSSEREEGGPQCITIKRSIHVSCRA